MAFGDTFRVMGVIQQQRRNRRVKDRIKSLSQTKEIGFMSVGSLRAAEWKQYTSKTVCKSF